MLSRWLIARGATRRAVRCGDTAPLPLSAHHTACPAPSTHCRLRSSAAPLCATSAVVCARRSGSSVGRAARAKAAAAARATKPAPRPPQRGQAAAAASVLANPLLETSDTAGEAADDDEGEELDVAAVMTAAGSNEDPAAVAADGELDEYGEVAEALGSDAADGLASRDRETRLDGEMGDDGDAAGAAASQRGRRRRARTGADAVDADAADAEHAEGQRGDEGGGAAAEKTTSHLLAASFPDLAAEYLAAGHDANAVPVEEVRVESAVVAVWQCAACGHVWRCGVFVRCILKTGCPKCVAAKTKTLGAARPELLQLWDSDRNDPFIQPADMPSESPAMVFWRCPVCRDSFAARVRDRVRELARCPTCELLRTQSVDALSSEEGAVLQEWHPLKNGDLRVDQVSPTDRKTRVWWLCSGCGHEWQASLLNRLSRQMSRKGRLCPACHGKGAKEFM